MKISPYLITFLCAVMFVSCSLSKKISDNNCYLKKVSDVELDEVRKNFSINLPNNWYTSYGAHCALFHAPKELRDGGVIYYANELFLSKYSSDNKSIEKIKEEHIKNTRYNKTINTKLFVYDFSHKKYGDSFSLKYGKMWNGINYTVFNVYIKYKENIYHISYSSHNEYYEKYLPEVLKIIESLEIKE